MNRNFLYALLPVLLLFWRTQTPMPLEQMQTVYNADVKTVQNSIEKLKKTPTREHFLALRANYKRIEFWIEFADPSAVRQFNGPNLVKPDAMLPNLKMYDPTGLQALEGFMYEADIVEDTQAVVLLCQQLEFDLRRFNANFPIDNITDAQLIMALRQQVLNVAYKSLVGFDTPLCKNALVEAHLVLQHQAEVMAQYDSFGAKYCPEAYKKLMLLLTQSAATLAEAKDFEAFDRFNFYKNYAHPLYAAWYEFHKASGLEMPLVGKNNFTRPVFYNSNQPFDKNFLNPWYYSRHKTDQPDSGSIALGRTLFFDTTLSKDNKQSCATCHHPDKAFTDGKITSLSVETNEARPRNSPTLMYSALQNILFYDGRAHFLEDQLDHVVFHPREFNTNYEDIIVKLQSDPQYISQFLATYTNQPKDAGVINGFTISKALADYVRSLQSFNSDFDQMMRGEKPADPEVTAGFNLFMGKALCGTCHFAPVFNGTVPPQFIDTEMEVLGVPYTAMDSATIDPDMGKYYIQQSAVNQYSFKTAGLRNVGVTAPYMHNGCYNTLEEVLHFYQVGGGVGFGQDVPNQTLPFDKLDLKANELVQLKAFMLALTDH